MRKSIKPKCMQKRLVERKKKQRKKIKLKKQNEQKQKNKTCEEFCIKRDFIHFKNL